MTRPRIAIAPAPVVEWVAEAVDAGGGDIVNLDRAEGLVWTSARGADDLREVLAEASAIRWVQLPWAGVEEFAATGMFGDGRQWTCGKGVYAEPVAEHALALAMAGLRDFPERQRARSWGRQSGRSLYEAPVTIVGGGGIARSLLDLLQPLRADVTVVNRSGRPLAGAARTLTPDRLHEALLSADVVVLALALTPETERIIDAEALLHINDHAWLVNVARGRHVDTDALVSALEGREIGGAGLDVTDPEPLPDGHPLWTLPNVIITPHTANTYEMAVAMLGPRITENVRRFAAGGRLIGTVDSALGY